MKLSKILNKDSILILSDATDKWDLIQQMIDALLKTPFAAELPETLRESFFEEIERRENVGSTGLGEEIALPHARMNGLERPLVAFAVVQNGVDFDSPDGLPAKFAFLTLLPAARAELGVKVNSAYGRFLMQPEVRVALLRATSAEDVLHIMDQTSLEIDAPIIALDLMRPERVRLKKELSIQEAMQVMHRSRTTAAPVLDADQQVIGELNCNHLFHRELPDYIRQLHSVPHITDFSPFQSYFSQNADLTVGDLMNDCESIIDENGSLLEIIFLLSVKKHPLLYVCRDKKLIGVIDPITVMDKILNL